MSGSDAASPDGALRVDGLWFEPGSAKRHRATLAIAGDEVRIESETRRSVFARSEVRCSSLGEPVTVELPDKSSFVVFAGQAGTPILVAVCARGGRLVRKWERSLAAVVFSLVGAVGLIALLVLVILPAAVRPAAFLVPDEWTKLIDDQVLLILENQLLEPSALSPERQREIESEVLDMVKALGLDASRYRVLVWAGEDLGANAFALPGGTLIVTDEMVELTETDEEPLAVMAHEVGHVEKRHGLQQILRGSGLAVLLVLIGPDPSTIAQLASGMPAVFLESGYSRDFEREADDFACDALERRGRGTEPFARILELLAAAHPEVDGIPTWISSHPDTAERIRAIRAQNPK